MPQQPGTTLGPYEILSPIGAGGMCEVYKARDTRLDRTVAIKVLPEHVAPAKITKSWLVHLGPPVVLGPEDSRHKVIRDEAAPAVYCLASRNQRWKVRILHSQLCIPYGDIHDCSDGQRNPP